MDNESVTHRLFFRWRFFLISLQYFYSLGLKGRLSLILLNLLEKISNKSKFGVVFAPKQRLSNEQLAWLKFRSNTSLNLFKLSI